MCHQYREILRKSQALVLISVCSYLTVNNSRLLEHECNNPHGLREREREKEYIVRRKQYQRRDLREKVSQLCAWSFPEDLKLHNRLQWNCVTLSRYNINTVPVDVASSLEANHVKYVCCATVSCDYVYLFAICYLIHELCLTVNECMYDILQLQ